MRIVIHHAGGSINRDHTAEALARLHVRSNGWPGIGYHFLVHWDGTIEYVGDLGTSRAHVGNINRESVGICIPGNFQHERPPAAAIAATRRCIAAVRLCCGAVPVVGHRDVAHLTGYGPTSCPGDTWEQWRAEVAA